VRNAFTELKLGGILVAPFTEYAAIAFVLFVVLRIALKRINVGRYFSNPAIVEVCLYLCVLAALIVVV
jgi:hypothetical protein